MKNKNIFIILGVLLVLLLTVGAVFTMLAVPGTPNVPDEPSDETTTGDILDNGEAYNVTLTLLGATNGDTEYTIGKDEKLNITVTANDCYFLPSAITVSGADYIWDVVQETRAVGILEIFNPSSDVSVTIEADNRVNVEYTVVNNTGSDSPDYTVEYCASHITSGYTETAMAITTNGCKIEEVYSDELQVVLISSEGGQYVYAFDWGGGYPSDGVLNITITLVDDTNSVMFSLSNCSVSSVTKS